MADSGLAANPGEVSATFALSTPAPVQATTAPPEPARAQKLPVDALVRELEDAERLLSYAARAGIEIEKGTRDAVLSARAARGEPLSTETAESLLSALTQLAVRVRPVTAESLYTCDEGGHAHNVIRGYTVMTALLFLVIVPCSLISFISAPFSDRISKEIESGNELALKLNAELLQPPHVEPTAQGAEKPAPLRPPYGVSEREALADLQHFTMAIRTLDVCATKLNIFAFNTVADPFATARTKKIDAAGIRTEIDEKFELPVPPSDLAAIAADKIVVYQSVRYYAQQIQGTVSAWFAAITSCILPALYAMLGACAYLLRSLEDQLKRRTFAGDRRYVRFIIAAIGGLVVGLFTDFNLAEGAKIPPLGIAFLLGYAVDVFFSFLETMLQTFGRSRAAPPATPAQPGA